MYPFKYKGTHHCEAGVLTCIDFRFWEVVTEFVKNELKIESFDFPSLPGSTKPVNEVWDIKVIKDCVAVSVDLHQIKKFLIFDHQDCGAYGGSGKFPNQEEEREFHNEKLREAKTVINQDFPELEVLLYYIKLNEEQTEVEFVKVD